MSKRTPWLLLAFTLFFCTGCYLFIGERMTTEEVQKFGTHVVSAPKEKVYKAVTGTLQSLGFNIAVEDQDKGIIKTDRKLIRAGSNGDNAVGYYRRYDLKITELPDGKFQIVANPKIYAGDNDLSNESDWVLDGPQGERVLWKSLFKDIDELL